MKSFVASFLMIAIFVSFGFVNAKHECGSNASPASCGSVCEPTCTNPRPKNCPLKCILNGCRCNDGYVRNEITKECVLYRDCTKKCRGNNV